MCCVITPFTLWHDVFFTLWRSFRVLQSDICVKDVKWKYCLLAGSVQNYLRCPLTVHTACNSTPAWQKPAAQTHSSHVHIYCSMPNTSLPLPTQHWPSAVLLHLKSDFRGDFTPFEIHFSLHNQRTWNLNSVSSKLEVLALYLSV